jgi:hypothetical protein
MLKIVSLTLISSLALATTSAAVAIAQVNTAPTLSEQTLRDSQQQEKSPLSVGGGNLNILQIINNLNLSGGRSPEQFRANQEESLDETITNFRSQQRREVKISIPNK